MRSHIILPLLFATSLAASGFELLNVNFNGFTGGDPPGGPAQDSSTLVGPAGGLGTSWNQYAASSSSGIMVDSTNGPTSVTVATNFSEGRYDGTGPSLTMLRATLTDFSKGLTGRTVTISGLEASGLYDVWIVSHRHQGGAAERQKGTWTSVNTTTSSSSQLVDGTVGALNGSTFVAGVNYALFENVQANGTGQIVFNGKGATIADGFDADYRHHLNGIQIAPAAGAAPSDFQLIISPNGLNYDFAWNSLEGKLYDLVGSPDLVTPISTWPVWDGRMNVLPTPPTNTLTQVPGGGDKRFFAIVEKDAPPPTTAPELSSVWGSGTTITLNFTEELEESAATDPLNYDVFNSDVFWPVTFAVLSPDGKTVTLSLGSALAINTTFNVTMSNLTGSGGTPLGGSTTVQFQSRDDAPDGIQVFILAGQSNMVGYGKTEQGGNPAWLPGGTEPKEITGGLGCLRYLAVNNGSFPDYDYTSLLVNPADPPNSAWKTRGDVKVWWRNGHSTNLGGEIGKGDLGPPFRGANTGWFGPEYGFGQVIGDFYSGANERPVLIIKAAWGGRSLGGDFRPPSAVANRGGVVGPFYTGMLADVREVLGDLAAQFPAAQHPEFSAVGYRYRIAGIGWHQGWNDGSEPLASEYKDNLPDLISDLRAEFGNPDLPFTIGTTGMGGNKPVEPPPYSGYSKVERAQLWVAGVAQPAAVLSNDTRPYWRDASISPSTLGFHWNHNAESYFLVGKGLADNMQTLLSE